MRFNFSEERILVVAAHPDDAEVLAGGMLSRARDEGTQLGVCVLCRGEKGQASTPVDDLAGVRRQEAAAAAQLVGGALYSADVPDGTLSDDEDTRRWLTATLREFRPSIVFGHWKEDYHPDHQAASRLVEAATWFAASRGHDTGEAPLARAPAVWWMDTVGMAGFEPTFYLDVSDFVDSKEALIRCHTSQLVRGDDEDFAPLVEVARRQWEARGMQAGVAAAEAYRQHIAFGRGRAW